MPAARRSTKKKPRPQQSGGEIWNPRKKGDTLAGEITRMDVVNTRFGESAIVVIKEDDGEEYGVWCGAVLGPELYDEYDVGDFVEVVFEGTEQLEGGNRRKNFKVYDLDEDEDE